MIFLIIFMTCFTAMHACTCKESTLMELACKADIVSMGRVLWINTTDTSIGGAVTYGFWHLRTYKGPITAVSTVKTSNRPENCGVTGLMEELDYLLSGRMGEDGVMQITSCDIVMPWYQVTPEEVEKLRNMDCSSSMN